MDVKDLFGDSSKIEGLVITPSSEYPAMFYIKGKDGTNIVFDMKTMDLLIRAGGDYPEIYKDAKPPVTIDPIQPETEAKLRDLGIMVRIGRGWVINKYGFKIARALYITENKKLTLEEYSYCVFLTQLPKPKDRGRVETLYYFTTPGHTIVWKFKKGKVKKVREKKPGKFKAGGQLIDNIQKSNKPKTIQLNLFETILQDTKDKMNGLGVTAEYINRKGEGIKLSKGEFRLLLCLSKLLHEKSQTQDKNGKDYYSGNSGYEVIKWETEQGNIEVIAPKISLTLYEVAREYYGDKEIGGENVRTVARMLFGLADNPDKKALIRYNRVVKMDKNRTREYYIERYESLISIATAGYREFLNGAQIDEKRKLVVMLHPVIRDQIETKSVDFPLDLTKRMIEAYGSPDISEITTKLMLELARAHSGRRSLPKDEDGNHIYTIATNTLYWKIADSYMSDKTGKPRRGPLLKKYFDKSIETCKALGLLVSYEIKTGKTGDQLIDFCLSKNWE